MKTVWMACFVLTFYLNNSPIKWFNRCLRHTVNHNHCHCAISGIHEEKQKENISIFWLHFISRLLSSLPCHQEMGSMPRNTSFVLPQTSTQPCIPVFRCQTCSGPLSPQILPGRLHTNITGVSITELASEGIRQTSPGDWGLQTAEAREVDALMATLGQKMRAGGSLFPSTHAYKPGPSQSTFYKIF